MLLFWVLIHILYCIIKCSDCQDFSCCSNFRLTHVNKKEQVEMQARLHLNLGLIFEQQNKPELAIDNLIKVRNS